MFALLATALPAQADTTFHTTAAPTVACANTGVDNGTEQDPNNQNFKVSLLPVQRWSSVPLHSRLPLNLDPTTWFPVMQQNTAAMTMGIGNSAWQVTSKVTTEASRFCIGDQVGRWLDEVSAATGKALYSSGVVAGIFVIVAAGILWRARRNGRLGAGLLKLLVVTAVLGSMVAGALGTTSTAYGKGSPGWWGATINTVVTKVAEAPLAALNDSVLDIVNDVSTEDTTSDISDCNNYAQVLETSYRDAFSDSSMVVATQSTDVMWRSAGLATWENLQFGNNKYASKVGCRLLEFAAGVPASRMSFHTMYYIGSDRAIHPAGGSALNPESMAFTSFNNDQIDQAMIGWAACRIGKDGTITAESEWKKLAKDPIDDAACRSFFKDSTSWGALTGQSAKFNFGDNLKDNLDRIGNNPGIVDFVTHLHGNTTADQTGVLALYVVASWICAAVFSLMALAVFLAKLALVALSMFAIWVLLAGLIKINEDGSKVAELAKHYVVMAFFAFGATALMTIVAMLTTVIHKIGSEVSGGNSTSAAFWAALAPVGAIVLCNLFFTKLLKAPSPFKPTSALAWGAAAGGTGLLAGAGMERMAGSKMRRAGSRLMGMGEKAVASRFGGKGGSRSGGMSPLGEVAKTGAGMALGASLAEHMHDRDEERREEDENQAKPTDSPQDGRPASGPGKPKKTTFRDLQEAHDFFSRGGREAMPSTGSYFRDNLNEAGMRMDQKSAEFRKRLNQLRTPGGLKEAAGDLAGSVGQRVANSEMAQRFSKNPFGAVAKAGMVGAGMVGGALVLGVPGAAIVGGGYAMKKARDARRAKEEFRRKNGGLTRLEMEQRQDELKRYREIQEAQAAARTQRRQATDPNAGPVLFGTGSAGVTPVLEVSDSPELTVLAPRPKMMQPTLF